MDRDSQGRGRGYALAVLATLAVLLLRLALSRWLGAHAPFLPFVAAVLLAAVVGGFRPGLLATLLGALAGAYFFLPPAYSFRLESAGDAVHLAGFAILGVTISALCGGLRDARRRAEARQAELEALLRERDAAESDRREGDARLRTLSDNLPSGAIYQAVQDAEGRTRITYISSGVERLLGLTAEEVMNDPRTLYGLIHPEDAPRMLAAEAEALRTLTPFDCEFRQGTRGGGVRWVQVRSAPRRLPTGETAWDGVVLDVTARKRAEQEVFERGRQMQLIADHAPVGIAHYDAERRYKFVNKPFATRLGLHPRAVVGKRMADVTAPAVYAALAPHVDEVLEGRRAEFELEMAAERGPRIYRFAYEPEREGGAAEGRVVGFVAAVVDITELKALEDRLRRQARELREADRRKDEFLATLAHELRNPLAPIRNALQILRLADDPAAALDQVRSVMERQLAQMVRLIDDLLDVSRITRGKLRLRRETVALAEVVQSAIETARPAIEASSHRLEVQLPGAPMVLFADATRLAQVLANLLNNAAKFTDPGGRIELAAERDGREAVVRVRDSGVGIPPEKLPGLFEMFNQLRHSLEKTQGGLGIGLTLARRIVEMHGGTIGASSAGLGHGSEFTVRLPVLQEAALAVVPPKAPGDGGPGPRWRILVVDDNVDAAQSLAMVLHLMGHEIHAVHNGLQALDAGPWFLPDVVLLDIGLPKLNGYDTARRLRQEAWGRKVILTALTGWGQDEDKRRASEAGFDFHLTKPVDPDALRAFLSNLESLRN